MLRLTEDWKRCRGNKETVAGVSLDLSKAFDTIPHSLLVPKLKAYVLSDTSCKLLDDYLTGRIQRVNIGDTYSKWKEIKRGVPQGSVLGPMLFNVFINDLFFHIQYVKLNAYADDERLYDSEVDLAELGKRLLRELNTANTWYNNNGMIVNTEKRQAIVLGKTNYTFSFPVKNSLELIGMIIDTNEFQGASRYNL